MTHQPTSIKKTEQRSLEIGWSDGLTLEYPFSTLRKACPCATCREKKRSDQEKPKNPLQVLSAAETVPLEITQMRPVGNYAYNITFSDGHSSGLFTMELLRDIGRPSSPTP
jgi:DUF971 family protein